MRYRGAKGKAWKAVSDWTRRVATDCYTCGATDLVGSNAQAGHFLPVGHVGSNNTLSWDHHQIRLQCGRCNGVGQGMQTEFRAGLVLEYGEEFVAELEQRRYLTDKVKDWDAIREYYEGKV